MAFWYSINKFVMDVCLCMFPSFDRLVLFCIILYFVYTYFCTLWIFSIYSKYFCCIGSLFYQTCVCQNVRTGGLSVFSDGLRLVEGLVLGTKLSVCHLELTVKKRDGTEESEEGDFLLCSVLCISDPSQPEEIIFQPSIHRTSSLMYSPFFSRVFISVPLCPSPTHSLPSLL